MLEALCELSGSNAADHLPRNPAEFFNLLGMAEWAEISEKYGLRRYSHGSDGD